MKNIAIAIATGATLFVLTATAADITWTGEAGDALWATPGNWKGGVVPGVADRATLYTAGLDANDPAINLGGTTQTVGSVLWKEATVKLTNGTIRLALGRAEGNTKATVNGVVRYGGFHCDVEQLADGYWKNGDSNGNCVYARGTVFGDGVISSTGNQNHNIRFEDAMVSVPSIVAQAAAIALVNSSISNTVAVLDGQYADGNFNGTSMIIDSSAFNGTADAPGVFQDGSYLKVVRSGGGLQYTPPAAVSFDQTIPKVTLESGRFSLRILNPTVSDSVLTISEFERSPGTAFSLGYNNTNNGRPIGSFQRVRIVGAENNGAGVIAPWAFYVSSWLPLAVSDENGTINALPVSNFTLGLPTDGGSKWALHRLSANNSYTLENDTDLWQLYANAGGDISIDLGDNTLRVFGSITLPSWGNRTISANGSGRLVFAGEDIILAASGSYGMYITAPIEWEKPAGSAVQWPCIVIPEGSKTDGIHFQGEDRICHYGSIMGSANGRYLVFEGDSDRVVHGDLADSIYIRQAGSGTLTLLGEDNRRSRAMQVTGGRVIIGHDCATVVNLVTNGALEVASGVTLSYRPVITSAGSVEGEGSISSGLKTDSILLNSTIAPGNNSKAGVLHVNGFAPATNFTFLCRFDSTTNSVLALSGAQFQLPAAPSTATLAVKAIRGSGIGSRRVIKPTDEFPIIDWSGGNQRYMRNSTNKANVTAGNAPSYLSWQIDNLSPKLLDTANARVFYDDTTQTVRMTGVKSINTTVVMIR